MDKRIIIDVIKEFSNSDIKRLKFKYKKLEIELEKDIGTEDNENLIVKDIKEDKKCKDEKWISSPIVGKFCKCELKKGDIVNKGDTLFTIEAMKTVNEIRAEEKYKILKIVANENDVLECNQKIVLVRKIYD